MRIGFLTGTPWEFTATTPLRQPTGGSESALCYLSAELATKLGHQVTVLNSNPDKIIERGVTFCHKHCLDKTIPLNGYFDVLICLNGAYGRDLRQGYRIRTPMVLWNHHAVFQPDVANLRNPEECQAWDRIVFVSDSQRDSYEREFGMDMSRTLTMHNGVCPAFEDIELPEPWYATGEAPVLFYTSTPYRGLDVLLDAFPSIRGGVPGVQLKIYSSMAVYRDKDDDHQHLFDKAKGMDGVEYIGAVGQAELARRLPSYAALAHPSTFPECHSIAAIEAMAAGAHVFTTDLGGQREATGGLAAMIPYHENPQQHATAFATMAIDKLREMRRYPKGARSERAHRVAYTRQHYQWGRLAGIWSEFLSALIAARPLDENAKMLHLEKHTP